MDSQLGIGRDDSRHFRRRPSTFALRDVKVSCIWMGNHLRGIDVFATDWYRHGLDHPERAHRCTCCPSATGLSFRVHRQNK